MFSNKEIQEIKIKMLKNGYNQTKLANELFISVTTLSMILSKKKTFSYAETKIRNWMLRKK